MANFYDLRDRGRLGGTIKLGILLRPYRRLFDAGELLPPTANDR